ncbi:hypothetical protein V1512DRAFT_259211 [Lipomyces arxii]|uniref:uncharacterized protein n=1 Tax=Lipomyces arxii TaxID=56418 RepID=UPI0034CF294C
MTVSALESWLSTAILYAILNMVSSIQISSIKASRNTLLNSVSGSQHREQCQLQFGPSPVINSSNFAPVRRLSTTSESIPSTSYVGTPMQTKSRSNSPSQHYILATPPPRRGSNRSLLYQVQKLSSRQIIPVFDIRRTKKQSSQFSVYSCDDIEHGKHDSLLRAFSYDMKFDRKGELEWLVRSEGDGADAGIVVVSKSVREGIKRIGRWTRSNDFTFEQCWNFVVRGETIATLKGNTIDFKSTAIEMSRRRGYLGVVRFEEALVFTAVYVASLDVFGHPPQFEKMESQAISTSSQPLPVSSSSVAPTVAHSIVRGTSEPGQPTKAHDRHLGKLTGTLLRRSRILLQRNRSVSSTMTV